MFDDKILEIARYNDIWGTGLTQPMVAIKNVSSRTWTVETPSGKLKTVEPQNLMPVKIGLKIKFGSFGSENYTGEIINQ